MTAPTEEGLPAGGPSLLLLVAPSANRVYAEATPRLAAAELAAFGETVLSARPTGVAPVTLAGVPYVEFGLDPTPDDLAYLGHVSSAYALYARTGELLRPLELRGPDAFDDDLVTIPKYAGKTNEQFTALLLNLTVLAATRRDRLLGGPLTVLDPLCGRGTTLNQALRYGYDAIGIELDGKDVEQYEAFLKTYLRRKRLKHTADTHPVRRDRRLVARRFEAVIAGRQRVTVCHGDTLDARQFLRAGCADVVVTDLPYGVAHGSRTPEGLSRRPLDLLSAAAPIWADLVRAGGALGISWNTHVASRADATVILEKCGFSVVDSEAYGGFEHWVDQAITRDVLVARKR